MKSGRWSNTAALGCSLFLALFLALPTFLALGLGAASVASAQTSCPNTSNPPPCHPPNCPTPLDPGTLEPPCWPNTTGVPALQESYSDIPWHQKLGTFAGNEFDEALVLPFAAVQGLEGTVAWNGKTIQNIKYCTTLFGPQPTNPVALQTWQARCMIETGINNIVGTLRTDTPYVSNDPLITAAKRCQPPASLVPVYDTVNTSLVVSFKCSSPNPPSNCPDLSVPSFPQPCIEVQLQLASYWTRSYDGTTLNLEQRPIGDECCGNLGTFNFGGFVLTDGTTYAPQFPWYMSHYCDSLFPQNIDVQDAVCYADYLSPFNDGFNNLSGRAPKPVYGIGDPWNSKWPNSNAAWSTFPTNHNSGAPPNHCGPKDPTSGATLTFCTIALAGFDLVPVTSDQTALPFPLLNSRFLNYTGGGTPPSWFNNALAAFATNVSANDLQRHFPWNQVPQLTWAANLYHDAVSNPFLGGFTFAPPDTSGCVVPTTPPSPPCTNDLTKNQPPPYPPTTRKADHFLYPRQCILGDLTTIDPNTVKLRQCGLVYELHPNGWQDQWPASFQSAINSVGMATANQYGRTIFLFAGVPGMQMPVSYYKDPGIANGLSVYERVHNSSVFSLYLPIANEADTQMAMMGRNYSDGKNEFYHDLLMSNHMEFLPGDFAEGIRGKVLWHDEYRSKSMYDTNGLNSNFPTVRFPAAFSPETATAPYHNYQCDACHVRNGSGIPTNTAGTLAVIKGGTPLSPFMNPGAYSTAKDYTFTGTVHPMKLVFFDLARRNISNSVYSNPAAFFGIIYANKIMNFYGDSFRVTQPGKPWSGNYTWTIDPIDTTVPHIEVVDTTSRINLETGQTYLPRQVNLGAFTVSASCQQPGWFNSPPNPQSAPYWPQACSDITGSEITKAITVTAANGPTNPGVSGGVGYMLLNGKRLGNSGALEAIPNGGVTPPFPAMSIQGFQQTQITELTTALTNNKVQNPQAVAAQMAGAIAWNVGTRAGNIDPRDTADVKLSCNPASNPSLATCWIGRFGWIGDRVSLEDQVANAAFIEMSMSSSTAYKTLYPGGTKVFPLRYQFPNCGLADKTCIDTSNPNLKPPGNSNADLFEQDINRMADYARWLGSPTRSEFTVSLKLVNDGEQVFKKLNCNSCHVIDKIPITDPNDTMMPPAFRNRFAVAGLKAPFPAQTASPFLSYLGTDLLMHDMGYLSQVGLTSNLSIRDPITGVVFPNYSDYVQKIRTPALKGLRFNRFVTDSITNTVSANPPNPACDFLLHDGRACDAIQAAFLHDGPEIKALGVIAALSKLQKADLQALRAFLYSL
jgi:CxxC motif-containing protein (DUF1111 family)